MGALTWADFWVLFRSSSKAQQKDLLKQLNINQLARSLSVKSQIEVFEFAPKRIIKQVSHLLHAKTKKRIGLGQDLEISGMLL